MPLYWTSAWSFSPRVEDTAPDTIVLDLAGLASLFGSEENIARQLTERAANLGLAANVAIAQNLEAALLASRGFAGITLIPPGEECSVWAACPSISFPLPRKFWKRWNAGASTLAGHWQPCLFWIYRNGLDSRAFACTNWPAAHSCVRWRWPKPSHSFEEEMTLEDAVEELEPLAFILGRLLDQLTARLETRSLAANSIRVQFELDIASQIDNPKANPRNSFALKARSKQQTQKSSARDAGSVPATAAQPGATHYEKVLTLPLPMRDSKMLLKLLRLQLQSDPPNAPIQKVMLAAEPANFRATQGGLFLPSYPDPEKLELTVARLANLVGDANIGSPEINRHAPPRSIPHPPFRSATRYRRENSSRGNSPPGHRIPHVQARAAGTVELLHKCPVRASFLACGARSSPLPGRGALPATGGGKMPGNKKSGTWKFFLSLLPIPVAAIKNQTNANRIAASGAVSIAFFLIPSGKAGLCEALRLRQ